MEAKVLRAALSAAIRVTVSTSLLGCGGVTTGGQGDDPTGSGPPATNSQGQGVATPNPGYGNNGYGYGSSAGGYPTSPGPSAGAAGTSPYAASGGSGGLAMGGGGAALAGAPAEAEPGAGGGPGSEWDCEEAQACVADLKEQLGTEGWLQSHTPRTVQCCGVVMGAVPGVATLGPECIGNTSPFDNELFWPCCEVLSSPSELGCTPWGPPVPPELDLERLLAWEAA